MISKAKGITIAGTTLLDTVKNIETYPKAGMLVHISDIKRSVGGCVPNVSINLAKIDRNIPIKAVTKIGKDENGEFIRKELKTNGINVDGVCCSESEPTGFCDVMSIPSGERTFFLKKGANSVFSPEDVDEESLACDMFHIGYIFLLDQFDKEDKEFGTVMARFLSMLQKKGIKTSIDVVSDATGNYSKKIIPALKYCDYFIVNEIECCETWKLSPYSELGELNVESIHMAMDKCIEAGVSRKVIVHCKEACFCLDKNGEFTTVFSLNVPKEIIKGTVGAGDAFCAGCLYGLYKGLQDKEILEFASAAAACNLLEANATDGMKDKNEIIKLPAKYGRLNNKKSL
ncbi:MAG: carbohydrate kinase family protein [Ruminococcaceae bacterium]|nr:carbohydrate kinase family protein [Oscillospiraceae bacterium]